MKSFCLVAFIALFCYELSFATASDHEESISLVSDIDDSIQSLEWKKKMNLSDVLSIHDTGAFTDIVYLISDGKMECIQFSKKPDLSKIMVMQSSVIIYGHMNKEREINLRKDPVLDQAFRTLPAREYFDL